MRETWFPAAIVLAGLAALTGCAPSSSAPGSAITFLQAPMDAEGLVGSTPDVLTAEFGQPVLRRVDGAAQVWLYHAGRCGLNLILYPDNAGTPRVAMVTPTADTAEPGQCTTDLQRAHVDAALEHPTSS